MRRGLFGGIWSVKILVLGSSHAGALSGGYNLICQSPRPHSSRFRELLSKLNVDIVSLPGKNWERLEISPDGIVTVPRDIVGIRDGSEKVLHSFKVTEYNLSNYSHLLWVQGKNPISTYWQFSGVDSKYPIMLTDSLLSYMLTKDSMPRVRLANRFVGVTYIGAPLSFYKAGFQEHKPDTYSQGIHSRNIQFMRSTIARMDNPFHYLMPPAECIDPLGRHTVDEYSLNPGVDFAHANGFYGEKLWTSFLERWFSQEIFSKY
jgi:hypothetical protein